MNKIKGVLWLGRKEAITTVYSNYHRDEHGLYSIDHKFPGPLGSLFGCRKAPPHGKINRHEVVEEYEINGEKFLLVLRGINGPQDSFLDRIGKDYNKKIRELKFKVKSKEDIIKSLSQHILSIPNEIRDKLFTKDQIKRLTSWGKIVVPPPEPKASTQLVMATEKKAKPPSLT